MTAKLSTRIRLFLLAAAMHSIFLGGFVSCASSFAADADRPALIDQPDYKSRLALQNAICKSLGVAYVVLADDALTHDSILIIEPALIRDFESSRLQGRETRLPERFLLVRGNRRGECVLIHDRTGTRMTLPDAHCKTK